MSALLRAPLRSAAGESLRNYPHCAHVVYTPPHTVYTPPHTAYTLRLTGNDGEWQLSLSFSHTLL